MKLKYVFSSLGILICLSVFADGVKPAKVGEQSPDFQFADKNGKMYSLKDFKGQYVFIDIWATHCFPCKEEIPYLEEIQEKLKKKNIAFIGIATDLVRSFTSIIRRIFWCCIFCHRKPCPMTKKLRGMTFNYGNF